MQVIEDKTARIAVTKGDSANFTIELEGTVPVNGTQALFTVKKDANGQALILKRLSVEDGVVLIALTSKDTNKLKPGKYVWDLRLIISEDYVDTPIPPTQFLVMEAVGDV